MNRISLPLLIFVITTLFGCALQNASNTDSPAVRTAPPPPPRTSPAKSVSGYLDALRVKNFLKAYDFISAGYAGNLDRESYRINMEQILVKKYNWALKSYEILGVRILGAQSYIVVELNIENPIDAGAEPSKIVQVQYELNAIEGRWKIVGDSCIKNCALPDGVPAGEGAGAQ
ncbi:MAG: hypothetical protein ACT4NX_07505 [Deltaproteobacteria bacterium]